MHVDVDEGLTVLRLSGTGEPPTAVRLVGSRTRMDGAVTVGGRSESGASPTWEARVPLRAARWGGPTLPLPAGAYALQLDGVSDDERRRLSLERRAGPTGRLELADGTLTVLPPETLTVPARTFGAQGLENAVFFESFYGRNAGDNPAAIDRELARRAPAVRRYWSVVDLSVPVPDGAVPLIEGTEQWRRVRGEVRLLVVNDWLRHGFRARPGQHVVQTWHGTPLKHLALHRGGIRPRRDLAVYRESRRWDVLLAQSPAAARVLRSAYAFGRRPIWVEGYPRNDVLVHGDAAAVRAALGIDVGRRVVLYAPTWRDDRERMVDFLDAEDLARRTGATVLVRGHSRTLQAGVDTRGADVVDVTSWGDTALLMLAADVLVTDYSSVMFDFAVTGRPMVFFTPDLEHYRGALRGFYFDLPRYAPGPVVRTQDALVEALTGLDADAYADRYAAWRARFTPRDDGQAARRVVARILDQGFVDRSPS